MARWNLRNLPPGFCFDPSDTESICYLTRKNEGIIDFIPEHDINRIAPDQLPQNCLITRGRNGELYFFTRRDPHKSRQTRSVGENYSLKSKNSCPIKACDGIVVGLKTSLEFHIRRGERIYKTNWRMHEYCLATSKSNKVGEFVLSKIYKLKEDDTTNRIEERLHQLERYLMS